MRACNTSATAIAATPSPRPVSPRPSVVVPDTLIGAPTAADSTDSASCRRELKRGELPTTYTDALAITQPCARTSAEAWPPRMRHSIADHPCRRLSPGHQGQPQTESHRTGHARPHRHRSDQPVPSPLATEVRPSTLGGLLGTRGHQRPSPREAGTDPRYPMARDALRLASTASASTRSSGRVTLKASSCPAMTCTVTPWRSTRDASSVAVSSSAFA